MKASDRLQAIADRVQGPADPPQEPPAARLRAAPDRPGVRVLVIVGVIAAVVAAGYLWASRPRPQAAPAPGASAATLAAGPTGKDAPGRAPGRASGRASAAPSAAPSATIVVHVLGKVKDPGVLTLPAGSRVAEAIKAAGGVRRGAETGTLNLARKVVDGEQIPVGVPAPTPRPGVPEGRDAPVNLNTATAGGLEELPGVGPVLAQRIIEYRTSNGGFRSVEQLQDVNGIGAARFADLKQRVRV